MSRTYSRADVETHWDNNGPERPAVNVKQYGWPMFPDSLLRAVAADVGTDGDAFAAWWEAMDDGELDRTIYGPDGYGPNYDAAAEGFEQAREVAADVFPRPVTIWQEGRSGGWLVVDGLPDPETWDAVALGRWRRFTTRVRAIADDQPYRIAWDVCANIYEPERVDRQSRLMAGVATLAGCTPAPVAS